MIISDEEGEGVILSYDQYNTLLLIALILAGVFFALAVILFFVLKIPAVIGDLSGSTARKAISEIRSGNAGKVHTKPARGSVSTITEKMTTTSRLSKPGKPPMTGVTTASLKNTTPPRQATVLLDNRSRIPKNTAAAADEATAVLTDNAGETAVLLDNVNETAVLGDDYFENSARDDFNNETAILGDDVNETAVLTPEINQGTTVSDIGYTEQTTVLSEEPGAAPNMFVPVNSDFVVRAEIVLFFSSEIITG